MHITSLVLIRWLHIVWSKVTFLGKAETAIRLYIKSWFADVRLGTSQCILGLLSFTLTGVWCHDTKLFKISYSVGAKMKLFYALSIRKWINRKILSGKVGLNCINSFVKILSPFVTTKSLKSTEDWRLYFESQWKVLVHRRSLSDLGGNVVSVGRVHLHFFWGSGFIFIFPTGFF